jgi:hypothetical protein
MCLAADRFWVESRRKAQGGGPKTRDPRRLISPVLSPPKNELAAPNISAYCSAVVQQFSAGFRLAESPNKYRIRRNT